MTQVTKAQARGEWIAYQRKLMGLTQPQLAEQIGVSPTTITRTEKGSRVIGLDELDALAEFFEVEPEYLLEPPLPATVQMGPSHDPAVGGAHNVVRLPVRDRSDDGGEVESTTVHYLRASQLPDTAVAS